MYSLEAEGILRLYGTTLFLSLKDYPDLVPKPTGEAIIWKKKPTERMTFFLSELEFRDKRLTDLLKNIVAALAIPFEQVGFGVIRYKPTDADWAQMPSRWGLVFGEDFLTTQSQPYQVATKKIYVVPALNAMIDSKENKRIAWEIMKTFKDLV